MKQQIEIVLHRIRTKAPFRQPTMFIGEVDKLSHQAQKSLYDWLVSIEREINNFQAENTRLRRQPWRR